MSLLPALGVTARQVLRRLHVVAAADARERERKRRAEREAREARPKGRSR